MNYIDITQPNQTLKLNLNYNGGLVSNGITFYVYEDGSDSVVDDFTADILDGGYYQTINLSEVLDLAGLKDETQYNIKGVDPSEKVVYRGKFQTTSKDILDYSINENKYTQKINSTNYTILD